MKITQLDLLNVEPLALNATRYICMRNQLEYEIGEAYKTVDLLIKRHHNYILGRQVAIQKGYQSLFYVINRRKFR